MFGSYAVAVRYLLPLALRVEKTLDLPTEVEKRLPVAIPIDEDRHENEGK